MTYKLDLRLVSLLLIPVSPRVRARGLLNRSRRNWEELNSLSSGLEKELVQLIHYRLNDFDHVLQPLSATSEFSYVGIVINSDGHQLFSRTMFRDILSVEVILVLLATLLLDEIGGSW